ncbi:hypothetical protein DSLASN_04340 [Desulfoluna limicola]|uniref:Uncharacterized protein n=1 Tax=Desulfoluna limicola TaxID=2810562 RepID=A0ABN6EZZ8_9BACT|nr:hypothetical protein [Desulfoluna limicola]BCS94802.1 hypothetical protein DSLASN_04340 [Desulfoluna limicola]
MKTLRHAGPLLLCVCLMLAGLAAPLRADSSLPMFFRPVEKKDARYDTPEHAVIARISSLVHRDIDWHFQTLTPETVRIEKQIHQKANLDPKIAFSLIREGTKYLIADSEPYLDYAIVTLKALDADGAIKTGASLIEQIDGQWKTALPPVDDTLLIDRLRDKMDYIRPHEILSVEGQVIPPSLGQVWLVETDTNTEKLAINAPTATEALVYLALGNITGHGGNTLTPEAIQMDTLLANHVAKPCQVAILNPGRVVRIPRLRKYDGAVLLCAFRQQDLAKAKGYLESDTELTLFGRLNDETAFLAKARK